MFKNMMVIVFMMFHYGIHANELKQENLKICLTGLYPSLCKQHLLTPNEKKLTLKALKRENLKTCFTGLYPNLCKQHLMTSNEKTTLKTQNKTKNKTKKVSANIQNITSNVVSKTYVQPKSTVQGISQTSAYTCSNLSKYEAYYLLSNGHSYLDRDGDGHPCEWGKVEGTYRSNCHYVNGYYRKSGTYVSGHTRCR